MNSSSLSQGKNTLTLVYKTHKPMLNEEILAELTQYTKQWSEQSLAILFDNVDNQLFDLAEKADTSTEQNTYFDAMRLIRLNRTATHKEFIDSISQNFLLETIKTEKVDEEPISDSDDLSLVADDLLEQDLATHGMKIKAERDNKKNLEPLNKRLTYLYKKIEINNDNNPMGPVSFCHSFAFSCNQLDVTIKVKLLVFKLFDRNFISKLHKLYEYANQLLIKNNILPHIKVSYKGVIKKRTRDIHREEASNDDEVTEYVQQTQAAPVQMIEAPVNIGDAQTYTLIQQLISQNKANKPILDDQHSKKDYASKSDIVESLANLQVPNKLTHSSDKIPDGSSTSDLLKAVLKQSLEGNQKKQSINQEDENLIDVIGMLFNFILDDDRFDDSVKALLSRLQIPIIKTALNDAHFFRDVDHPVRKLLNELANMGLGITNEINTKNNPLYIKLSEIINIIANEPVQNYNIKFYTDLRKNLQAFLKQFNNIPDKRDKQAQNKILDLVNNELSSRISQKELPHNIILLLELIWRDVLFDIYITDGINSDEWDMAITFVDIVIWSVSPKADLTNQRKLVKVIPGILKALNSGLNRINYSDNLRGQLLQDLQNCHLACMKGQDISDSQLSQNNIAYISHKSYYKGLNVPQYTAEHVPYSKENQNDTQVDIKEDLSNFNSIEDNLLAAFEDDSEQAIIDNDESELIEDEHTQQARALCVGAWVEFLGTNGKIYRAKISWKSDDDDAYIFVTQTGQIAEKSLLGLSHALRNKQASIIDESPVFERAMGAVLDDLQKTH